MVIAGSLWQIPIVKKIKQMGYKCLVVNLFENSPAFVYADYFEVVDILDKKKCLEIAKQYNIISVISEQCDIAMPIVAYIAEKLNLPSLGSKSASLYTNKYLMRNFCKKINFPYPAYSLCYNIKEAETFFNSIDKNIIIKPLDANSSRGVFKITSIKELKNNFSKSMLHTKSDKAIIVEKYIKGKEFTVDGIMINGKHTTLAISKKSHYKHNKNIANELFFSYSDDQFDYDTLRLTNDTLIETTKLADGCLTHVEYKFENGHYYLIEMAARGGGNLVSSHIVPLLSGFDNYEYLINSTLSASLSPEEIIISEQLKNRCAVLYFFNTPAKQGMVSDIQGESFLKESPNIINYKLNFEIGDKLEKAIDDAARIGFYIAYEESKEKLLALQETINETFNIIIE